MANVKLVEQCIETLLQALHTKDPDDLCEILDEFIYELKCEEHLVDLNDLESEENQEDEILRCEEEASEINNSGVYGQVSYLLEQYNNDSTTLIELLLTVATPFGFSLN
jgi:hypothetical protein